MEFVTTSVEVARVCCRKHSQVLRDLDRLRVILPEFERHLARVVGDRREFLLSAQAVAMLEVGQGRSAQRWKWGHVMSPRTV